MSGIVIIWTIAGAFAAFGIVCDALDIEVGGREIIGGFEATAIAGFLGVFATGFYKTFSQAADHARVLRQGRQLPAVILRVEGGSGQSRRQKVDVRFTVRVEPAGEAAYEIDLREEIHPIEAPRLQPGKRIVVAVDPRNPRKGALHLDATRALDG